MRIVWSPLASDRVSEAADYIAHDNPDAAEKWVRKLFGLVSRLPQSPRFCFLLLGFFSQIFQIPTQAERIHPGFCKGCRDLDLASIFRDFTQTMASH